MIEFLGKLHLVFLHLPIGLLVFALLLELMAVWHISEAYQVAAKFALSLGTLSAVLTATFGWMLSRQGGYESALLQQHQWLGFATAGLAVAAWWLRQSRWSILLLLICVCTLVVAGHFGGSLTHGSNFLFEHKEQQAEAGLKAAMLNDQTLVYQSLIQPIIKEKCLSCHNAGKQKGKLLLDTPEHMQKGGEHGKVFIPGNPDSSALIRRAMLPMLHDDHMPPAGKPQLSGEELTLLKWWIAEGADFQKKLGELKHTPEVDKILSKAAAAPQNPVFALKINPADPSDLQKIREKGGSVMAMGAESPWLSVSFAGNRRLDVAALESLKRVADQVAVLDLSNTNLDDRMFAAMADFPHLTRINLFQTQITDASLQHLNRSPYLDMVDLAGTQTTDKGVSHLSGLKQLRNLFLWRTHVTDAGRKNLSGQVPGLKIEMGPAPDTSSTPMALRAPKITYARNIFEDTVQVLIDFPKMVDVYYTMDEASPTTQSAKYNREPIVLNKTTTIRAISARPGWASSPIVDASFVKRKYKIKEATLQHPPNPKYPGNGANSLIDGKIADNFLDKAYLGYEGEHMTAVLDLGETVEVSRLSLHCMENNNSWIFAPRGLHVWTSGDGKTWNKAIDRQYPVNTSMQAAQVHLLSESTPQPVSCRFLKVQAESLLQNPKWHPGVGKKCWIFVDEILVE